MAGMLEVHITDLKKANQKSGTSYSKICQMADEVKKRKLDIKNEKDKTKKKNLIMEFVQYCRDAIDTLDKYSEVTAQKVKEVDFFSAYLREYTTSSKKLQKYDADAAEEALFGTKK